MTNIYVHQDLKDMNLYPCAYSMTFNVTGNKLNAVLNQRSQDMLAANYWNVVQYSALLIMMAKTANLDPGELVHVIADAHIYDRHIPIIEKIISNEPYDAPILRVADKTDFYEFTRDDFTLENYKYHDLDVKIPVAI